MEQGKVQPIIDFAFVFEITQETCLEGRRSPPGAIGKTEREAGLLLGGVWPGLGCRLQATPIALPSEFSNHKESPEKFKC